MYKYKEKIMIPKVIHYVWLGGKPLPKLAEKCIKSWKKFAPDYEIKEWNEANLNIQKYPFAQKAMELKDYAFASDVMRLDVLYENGGIYLDVDVELIRPIDEFLTHPSFIGLESKNLINPGAIYGSIAKNQDILDILEIYKSMNYIKDGKPNKILIPDIFTEYYKNKGFNGKNELQILNSIAIYPTEYFSPYDTITNKLHKTQNTHSIHHLKGLWYTPKQRFLRCCKKIANFFTFGLFGKQLEKNKEK